MKFVYITEVSFAFLKSPACTVIKNLYVIFNNRSFLCFFGKPCLHSYKKICISFSITEVSFAFLGSPACAVIKNLYIIFINRSFFCLLFFSKKSMVKEKQGSGDEFRLCGACQEQKLCAKAQAERMYHIFRLRGLRFFRQAISDRCLPAQSKKSPQ